jgi:preprotein translocase subunit SecG
MLFMAVVVVHVASCILLVVAVLLQSGKDAGLSGAFGMGGGGQTIFGARAGDVLSKATVVFAATFLVTCLLFTRIRPGGARSVLSTVAEQKQEAPAEAVKEPPAQPDTQEGSAGESGEAATK